MAVLTIEMLSSCGVPPAVREAHAKAALERKYGKEFEITDVYPQKAGDLFYRVQAYAVDEPRLRFKAAIDTEDDRISDDYVEKRICASISETLGAQLDRLPGVFYIFTYPGAPQPLVDDPEISVRDYVLLSPVNCFVSDLFFVPDKDAQAQEVYGSLAGILKKTEYLPLILNFCIVSEEQLDAAEALLDMYDENSMEYKRFLLDVFRVELSFVSGKLKMTEKEFTEAVRSIL